MMPEIETFEQLARWGWGLGFLTGSLIVILLEHVENDHDRDL